MLWHICVQRRQASAQRLHSSSSCFAHSSAQALQMLAQSRPNSAANFDCRLHTAAHCQQIEAQSRQARRQSAISGPILAQHCVTQTSHSWAHATHSSIHCCRLLLAIIVFLSFTWLQNVVRTTPPGDTVRKPQTEPNFFKQSRDRFITEAEIIHGCPVAQAPTAVNPAFSTASLRPCSCTFAGS